MVSWVLPTCLMFSLVASSNQAIAAQGDSTASMVRLEPVDLAGFHEGPNSIVCLSDKTRVLSTLADARKIIVLSTDGTSHTIRTKAAVSRIRCAGGKIYTLETLEMPVAKETAPGSTQKTGWAIRAYEAAGGTSATVRAGEGASVLDFLPAEGFLYYFSQGSYSQKTGRSDLVIWCFPLSSAAGMTSGETSVTIANATISRPRDFALYGGWLHYLTYGAGTKSGTRSIVFRVNPASGELQKVIEGLNIADFCILPPTKTLAFIQTVRHATGVFHVFGMSPIEDSTAKPIRRIMNVEGLCSGLWHDEIENALMTKVTSAGEDDRPHIEVRRLVFDH